MIAGRGTFVKERRAAPFRAGRRDLRRGRVPHRFEDFGERLRHLGGVLGAQGRRARREGPKRPAVAGAPCRRCCPSPLWLVERVLYRDGLILIIDKPAGVPVHAGPGGGHESRALFRGLALRPAAAAGAGAPARPRHQRLPRPRPAPPGAGRLGRLFAGGQVEKVYWAVVRGRPPAGGHGSSWRSQAPPRGRGWWMEADPTASRRHRLPPARRGRRHAWLECRPRTGRTHQIRVHCAELGCPVLGDPIYGGGRRRRRAAAPACPRRRPAALPQPAAGQGRGTPPPHMLEALRRCGYGGGEERRRPPEWSGRRHRPEHGPSGD